MTHLLARSCTAGRGYSLVTTPIPCNTGGGHHVPEYTPYHPGQGGSADIVKVDSWHQPCTYICVVRDSIPLDDVWNIVWQYQVRLDDLVGCLIYHHELVGCLLYCPGLVGRFVYNTDLVGRVSCLLVLVDDMSCLLS